MQDALAITIPTLAIVVSILMNRAEAAKLGDRLEARMAQSDSRMDRLEAEMHTMRASFEFRFDRMESRLDHLDRKIDAQASDITNIRERLARMEERTATRAAS